MARRRRRIATPVAYGVPFVLFAVVVLALAYHLSTGRAVLPPEPPELIAKRQSPENTYRVVNKAIDEGVPETASLEDAYTRIRRLERLNEELRDGKAVPEANDKGFMREAQQAAATLRDLRQSSTSRTWLLPTPTSGETGLWEKVNLLSSTVLAHALITAESARSSEKALRECLDVIALYQCVSQDGGLRHQRALASYLGNACLSMTRLMHVAPPRPAALQSALAELRSGTIAARTVPDVLVSTLRVAENSPELPPIEDTGMFAPLDRVRQIWKAGRIRAHTRDHMDVLYRWADLDGATFVTRYRARSIPIFPDAQWLVDPAAVSEMHEARLKALTIERGLRLAVQLELYRSKHGAYPESLSALRADMPDAVLTDAYCDTPFAYVTVVDDYALASCGIDGTIQLTDTNYVPGRDLFIHNPSVPLDDLIPAESPDLQRKRTDPANACFAIVEAYDLLPGSFPSEQESAYYEFGFLRTVPKSGTGIAGQSNPALAAYLAQADASLARIREALDAPYFLYPTDDGTLSPPLPRRYRASLLIDSLTKVCVAKAFYTAAASPASDEAITYLIDALRLCALTGSDGDYQADAENGLRMRRLCMATAQFLHEFPQTDATLMQLIGVAGSLDFAACSVETIFQYYLSACMASSYYSNWWTALKMRDYLGSSYPALRQLSRGGPCQWVESYRELTRSRESDDPWDVEDTFVSLLANRDETYAMQDGLMVVCYLELYRAYHGTYPATLATLEAAYPDAAAHTAPCGEAFGYAVENGDYRLLGLPPEQYADPVERYDFYYPWRSRGWALHDSRAL